MVGHALSQERAPVLHTGKGLLANKVRYGIKKITESYYYLPLSVSAVCDAGFCMNGGTCARHNFCLCPPGWSGTRCNTRKSHYLSIPLINSAYDINAITLYTHSCL